jgi:hypothetical protein
MIILAASLAWFAYWFVSARAATSGFEAWFEARRTEGWQAEYSDLAMRGFPNRLDATFENISLADPDTGFAWQAPFFQLLSLTYQPQHLIAVWPHEMQFATPNQKIAATSEEMRASIVFDAGTAFEIDRANFASNAVNLTSSNGGSLSADKIQFALRRSEQETLGYQVALQADGLAPPKALRNEFLPETLSDLALDMSVQFDRPWDLYALEIQRPQPTGFAIRTAKAVWGDLEFHAAGQAEIDAAGQPNGELTLRAQNWRRIIEVARSSGQFASFSLDAMEQGIELLATLSGSGENLDVTLTFRNGATFVGPLPIGPAPKLILR